MKPNSRQILVLALALTGAALLFVVLPSASMPETSSSESLESVLPVARELEAEVSMAIPSLGPDIANPDREARAAPTLAAVDDVESAVKAESAADSEALTLANNEFLGNFEEIERWHSQLMDRSKSLEDKIVALDMLRFHKLEDGQDARTEDDFHEALWMLEVATTDRERLGVLRAMKGFHQEELLGNLVDILKNDPSPRVRAESAEVLGDYGNNQNALSALRLARTDDPHEHVREKCDEILQ